MVVPDTDILGIYDLRILEETRVCADQICEVKDVAVVVAILETVVDNVVETYVETSLDLIYIFLSPLSDIWRHSETLYWISVRVMSF